MSCGQSVVPPCLREVNLQTRILRRKLIFRRAARTSRGVYHEHLARYVLLRNNDNPEQTGIGECSPLPDLSCDYSSDYEQVLLEQCRLLEKTGRLDAELLRPYPSILFGLETALRHFEQAQGQQNSVAKWQLWDSAFSRGERGLIVNGLIWMGDIPFMAGQIENKLSQGFSCLKLKIGSLNFEDELALLASIRKRFPASVITLRVDANGAFAPDEALDKLNRLAELELHSIEQPIRAGQWEAMALLALKSPMPIALDEELIGTHSLKDKYRLLDYIKPQFIVLKPTLHGGFSGVEEWVELAENMGIRWWATSALESNIGLNAIAQWAALRAGGNAQGLGTGGLYENNVPMPLLMRGEHLWLEPEGSFPDVNAL
jgi:o-succinylbenzoate synthase